MQVECLVRISLPDEGWDVNMLEATCWKAGRATGMRSGQDKQARG